MGHKPRMTPKKDATYRQQATPLEGPGKLPLTDRTAQEEAERRWGESGRAWHGNYARRGDLRFCLVGECVGDVMDEWQIFGMGPDWQSAFEDAERRGH